jgi:hypothetical protein
MLFSKTQVFALKVPLTTANPPASLSSPASVIPLCASEGVVHGKQYGKIIACKIRAG